MRLRVYAVVAMERRRTLAEANARLEARVAARTEALELANRELQHEVHERHEAEARLKRAQADLVQAGKLSALHVSEEDMISEDQAVAELEVP